MVEPCREVGVTHLFIHDIIKIKYVASGYLKNYPYHLISDKEMIQAFINTTSESCYFYDQYPCIDFKYKSDYDVLVNAIQYHTDMYLNSSSYVIPDWVYSYMLGTTVSIYSDSMDIHDLLVLLGIDNIDDEFSTSAFELCYKESKRWITRQSGLSASDRYVMIGETKIDTRPPTFFGEPHVIKSLRLKSASPFT